MVLFNPMSPRLLQLVTSHPATNKTLFPRRAPVWAGDASKLSPAQLRSAINFAQYAMNNLRGMTGTTGFRGNTVSRTAVEVFQNYPDTGVGAFGGQSPEARRQAKREQAQANVDRLQTILSEKEAAEAQGRVATDGGQPRGS